MSGPDRGPRRGVAGAGAVMLAGTFTSRILGMVKAPLLLGAVIGANTGVADAFSVANRLPNTIYLLLVGGVLNAILVPQVVRAIKQDADGGQSYINRLLTLGMAALAVLTLVLTFASPVLVRVYGGTLPAEWYDLAVTFGYWCIPQIFFYGTYALIGQVLNAKNVFGPYTWAPALNNVVAIAGLGVYFAVYGGTALEDATDASVWGLSRTALLAGAATAGVAAQALILIVPLVRSGFRYRVQWGLKGMGGASRMALWAFAAMAMGQLAFIITSRAAAHARRAADGDLGVAGNAAYDYSYLIYSLPTSLVTVSLVTALFTRMSAHAADRNLTAVRGDLSQGLRVIGVFTVLATAGLMVLSEPLVGVIAATVSYPETQAIARIVVAMGAGLTAVGIFVMCQRTFFAFEDAKGIFRLQLLPTGVIAAGSTLAFWLPPAWTVLGIGVAMAISNWLGAVLAFLGLRRHLRRLDGARILRTHLRLTLAVVPAALTGWALLTLWGTGPEVGLLGSLARLVVIGTVITAIYLLLARLMRVEELGVIGPPGAAIVRKVVPRLPGPLRGPGLSAGVVLLSAVAWNVPVRRLVRVVGEETKEQALDERTDPDAQSGRPEQPREPATSPRTTPGVTVIVGGRYDLGAELSAPEGTTRYLAHDRTLDREVEILLMPETDERTQEALDAARRAALVEDHRLERILEVGTTAEQGFVVTVPISGWTLAELAHSGGLPAEQARAIIGEAAGGLETARRHGVRHRALQLEDIRVTRDGGVVVAGLGVAAALRGSNDELQDLLEASRSDATDLVSLLSFALTGAPAAAASDTAAMSGAINTAALAATGGDMGAPPPPPPSELDELIAATARGAGPGSAGELLRALAPWPAIDVAAVQPGAAQLPEGARPLAWAPLPSGGGERTRFSHIDDEPASGAGGASGSAPAGGVVAGMAGSSAGAAAGAGAAGAAAGAAGAAGAGALASAGAAVLGVVSPIGTRLMNDAASGPSDAARLAQPALRRLFADTAAAHRRMGVWWNRGQDKLTSMREGPSATAQSAQSAPEQSPGETSVARSSAPSAPSSASAAHAPEAPAPVHPAAPTAQAPANAPAPATVTRPSATDPAEGEPRINPAPIVLCLVLAALVLLTYGAIRTLFSPTEPVVLPPHEPAAEQTEEPTEDEDEADEPEPEAQVEEAEEGEEPIEPAIASLTPLDPEGDGQENPDLVGLALDGDSTSWWRSRFYVDPEYGMKSGIGMHIELEEQATVGRVVIDLRGQGGLVEIRATGAGSPTEGEVLASGEMGPDSEFTFEPLQTDSLVLWFPRLPVAESDGENRLEIARIELGVE